LVQAVQNDTASPPSPRVHVAGLFHLPDVAVAAPGGHRYSANASACKCATSSPNSFGFSTFIHGPNPRIQLRSSSVPHTVIDRIAVSS